MLSCFLLIGNITNTKSYLLNSLLVIKVKELITTFLVLAFFFKRNVRVTIYKLEIITMK